jgi:hypothetical protein
MKIGQNSYSFDNFDALHNIQMHFQVDLESFARN